MNVADVLSGRANLTSLQCLLRSPTVREVLTDQLANALRPGTSLGPCHLRKVDFKPWRKLHAYYDVHVLTAGSEAYHVRPVAVTWRSDTEAERCEERGDLANLQDEATRRGVMAPFHQLLADYPRRHMRIQVSPLDARFQQLVRLSDPLYVRALLADAYASSQVGSDPRRISDLKITAIKYRPGKRHVLRYSEDGVTEPTVFAKVYVAEDGERDGRRKDGGCCCRVAERVADWLAVQGEGVNGLRPLAYVPEDAVVLYPRICGVPLSDYARSRKRSVARWLQRAGAALRTLHQLPEGFAGSLHPPRDFEAEVRMIARKSNHIPALLPQTGSAIAAVLDRAQELHDRLPLEPPTFTHGDLKTEHIWVAAGGLTLMDLDSSRLADPAQDIGYFLADWQFQQAVYDRASVDEIYERFLAGYGLGMPEERVLRAHVYEAVELVKCAERRLQLFERDWASRMIGLIARAEAVLNEVQRNLGFSRAAPPATSASVTRLPFGELDSRQVKGAKRGRHPVTAAVADGATTGESGRLGWCWGVFT